VKYYYNLKFKIYFSAASSSFIIPVFSVTWSRNHSMMICCSRNIPFRNITFLETIIHFYYSFRTGFSHFICLDCHSWSSLCFLAE